MLMLLCVVYLLRFYCIVFAKRCGGPAHDPESSKLLEQPGIMFLNYVVAERLVISVTTL